MFTCTDVRRVYALLAAEHGWTTAKPRSPEWEGSHYLEEWSPGDGVTRYRVMRGTGNSGNNYGPFGASYWLGARQAYEALVNARFSRP